MADHLPANPTNLLIFLRRFLAEWNYYGPEYKRHYSTEHSWNKALCNFFCSLVRPLDLPMRLCLTVITHFADLQEQF